MQSTSATMDAEEILMSLLRNQIKNDAHCLLISFSSQAHIAACFTLGLQLTARRVDVTFVALDKYISQIVSQHTESELMRMTIHLVPVDGEEEGDIFQKAKSMENSFRPYFERLLRERGQPGRPKYTCLLADRFLVWTKDVARQLEIPWYVFYSSCAIEARMHQAAYELYTQGRMRVTEGKVSGMDEIVKADCLQWMRTSDLPWSRWAYPEESLAQGEFLVGAAGLVINTVKDLERPIIESIENASAGSSQRVPKVYAIGPLARPPSSFVDLSLVGKIKNVGNICVRWLDRQPPHTCQVLYVSFGTVYRLKPRQILALALALENSQQTFVWVLPRVEASEDVLPSDYQRRIRGRGLVLNGWVNQAEVLQHPCVRGFISHCGWSSCLESIRGGVPILAWPQGADQHANCRYLTTVLKTAIPITRKRGDAIFSSIAYEVTGMEHDDFVEQQEIENGIRLLMSDANAKEIAQHLSEFVEYANVVDGRSFTALHKLSDHMKREGRSFYHRSHHVTAAGCKR